MSRILVIGKRPTIDRLTGPEFDRLVAAGVVDATRLQQGRSNHEQTLERVLALLAGHEVDRAYLDEVGPHRIRDAELVISVGGDGAALAVGTWLDTVPLLAVNSDPASSVGHYTRCDADSFEPLFRAWCAGTNRVEHLHRLAVATAGSYRPFLNDCLICNSNPGAMSRYLLRVDGTTERQSSSGIWISTPTGSTGAIASAGCTPVPADQPALLFKVREPFHGHGAIRLLQGAQSPPRGLEIIAGPSGLAAYIDGKPTPLDLPTGTATQVVAHPTPLHLVSG